MTNLGDRGAIFSPDRVYRYALWRVWNPELRTCLWIGLNPSTADELKDDPTIRRCIRFSSDWGYGSIMMMNLFAFRATEPRVMQAANDPIGPENDCWLDSYLAKCGMAVAAWGTHGGFNGRAQSLVDRNKRELMCLGLTKHGHPKHPLYVAASTKPIEFSLAGDA